MCAQHTSPHPCAPPRATQVHRQQCHPPTAVSYSADLATYYRIVETRNGVPVPVTSSSSSPQRRRTQSDDPTGPGVAPLTFDGATLLQNNLGGFGPDNGAEEMRFSGIGQNIAGTSIDLVVTITGEQTYEPYNVQNNMINGLFGQINQKAGIASDVEFCFQDTSTGQNVVLDGFGFEFHDFDNGENSDGTITWCREVVTVGGMTSWEISDNFDPPVTTQLSYESRKGGSMEFKSTTRGIGADNAQDPDDLTDLQKSRMVELLYVNTQCVTMR